MKLEGLDEFNAAMNFLGGRGTEQVIRAAIRSAAKGPLKRLKSIYPQSRTCVKLKFRKVGVEENTSAALGYWGSKKNKDQQFKYMKTYWREFGTLQNRMKGHKFSKPISEHSTAGGRRPPAEWKGGIQAADQISEILPLAMQQLASGISKELPAAFEKQLKKLKK